MAKAWLAGLLSELHRGFLKPAGFRKDGNTFFRDRGEYIERFNFQGSSWSSSTETVFYLNCGVEFKEFAPEPYWMYFRRTHWACRVEQLVPDAPDDWRCNESTNRLPLRRELACLVIKASEQMAARIAELRASYLARKNQTGQNQKISIHPIDGSTPNSSEPEV